MNLLFTINNFLNMGYHAVYRQSLFLVGILFLIKTNPLEFLQNTIKTVSIQFYQNEEN